MFVARLGSPQVWALVEDVDPDKYETFLAYLSFANFNVGAVLSCSCYFSADFYYRL